MKRVVLMLVLLSFALVFGCLTQKIEVNVEKDNVTTSTTTGGLIGGEEEEKCNPAYSFGELSEGKYGKYADISVVVSCADGHVVKLVIGDYESKEKVVEGNESQTLVFTVTPPGEGSFEVVLLVDGNEVSRKEWKVGSLGNAEIDEGKADSVSLKQWIAQRVDVDYPINVGSIGVYVRKPSSHALKGTYLSVELRRDDGGKPGSLIASAKRDIKEVPVAEKWIWFNFEDVSVDQGRYWVVLKVEMDKENVASDVVLWSYLSGGEDSLPNDYTLQMTREWSDRDEAYHDTQWVQLPYDKNYGLRISPFSR